jgi:hypothetical protein
MSNKNYCEYRGHYHTDFTLPSEYFLPDVKRPDGLRIYPFDFTYLFHKNIDNSDFKLMGEGQQIRKIGGEGEEPPTLHDTGQRVGSMTKGNPD